MGPVQSDARDLTPDQGLDGHVPVQEDRLVVNRVGQASLGQQVHRAKMLRGRTNFAEGYRLTFQVCGVLTGLSSSTTTVE